MGSSGQILNKEWQPDFCSDTRSWMHTWDCRAKIIAMLVFIFGIVSLDSLGLLFITFSLVMLTAASVKIPYQFILKRAKWVIPFLLFIFVGLILGRGIEYFNDSAYFAAVVSLKALTSIVTTILVLGTQPLENFFKSLSELKVPRTIISVLFLSYRYIFLYREVFMNTYRALLSRGFTNTFGKRTLKIYGEIIGALFIKALDRSEIVFKSMENRGFDGYIPIKSADNRLKNKDIFKTAGVIIITFLLLGVDWGVIG